VLPVLHGSLSSWQQWKQWLLVVQAVLVVCCICLVLAAAATVTGMAGQSKGLWTGPTENNRTHYYKWVRNQQETKHEIS
jgi:hypothetical protein